jgi:hypothetical protein
MTTAAYAAKRAVVDRLVQRAAQPGNALSGVQVAYSWPGNTAAMECVYGGGVTFDQPGTDDAVDSQRHRLVKETATVGVHIRIAASPPDAVEPIRATDARAEAIGDEIGALLAAQPGLAGGSSVARLLRGQGDYSPTDDQAVSTLSYQISVESYIQPGG